MQATKIAKCILVTYALLTSPVIGFGFLIYILYQDDRLKKIEKQLRARVSEDSKERILIDNLEDVEIKEEFTSELHENCIIQNYKNKVYRIMKPSGDYVPKIFLSSKDAKQEIKLIKPFLKKEYKNNIL
jgi:hypothetical protein